MGGSFDLNENVKKRAHTKMIKNLERVPIEDPGAHKGAEFQSWEARVERKRTKAAVGDVGGCDAPASIAAQVTSMARLERQFAVKYYIMSRHTC